MLAELAAPEVATFTDAAGTVSFELTLATLPEAVFGVESLSFSVDLAASASSLSPASECASAWQVSAGAARAQLHYEQLSNLCAMSATSTEEVVQRDGILGVYLLADHSSGAADVAVLWTMNVTLTFSSQVAEALQSLEALCSVTDGSGVSDAYPCTCGTETCATNERCHESINLCQAGSISTQLEFVVNNIDYDALIDDGDTLQTSFKDAILDHVMQSVPAGITRDMVEIFLSRGSVRVTAVIAPTSEATVSVEEVTTSLADTTALVTAVTASIQSIDHIEAVATGPISVTSARVVQLAAAAASTTTVEADPPSTTTQAFEAAAGNSTVTATSACSPGSEPIGAGGCEACPPGTFGAGGLEACAACPAGQDSSSNSSACAPTLQHILADHVGAFRSTLRLFETDSFVAERSTPFFLPGDIIHAEHALDRADEHLRMEVTMAWLSRSPDASDLDAVGHNLTAAIAPHSAGASQARFSLPARPCQGCYLHSLAEVTSTASGRRLGPPMRTYTAQKVFLEVAEVLQSLGVAEAPESLGSSDPEVLPELLMGPAAAISTSLAAAAAMGGVAAVLSLWAKRRGAGRRPNIKIFLALEGLDCLVDLCALVLAMGEGDLEFSNDGGAVLAALVWSVGMSILLFFVECLVLFRWGHRRAKALHLIFASVHLAAEDAFQAALYVFVGASQAQSGLGIQAASVFATVQSVAFLFAKVFEIMGGFDDSRGKDDSRGEDSHGEDSRGEDSLGEVTV